VVSDWNAVDELMNHGYAENGRDAARRTFNGGLDMEMVSTTFNDNLEDLLNKKLCSLSDLDKKVGNILRVKFKMNLFENYYTDPSRQSILLDPKHKEAAKIQALQCPVLLQNKNNTLPIGKNVTNLAVIGALADDPDNQLGTWSPDGKSQDSITPLTSLKQALTSTNITFSAGYKNASSTDTSLIAQAVAAAQSANKVLIFVGESNNMSGEAAARAYLNLPGIQEELVKEIAKTGKPIALIVYGGRSMTLETILPYADSVLYAWHLGTMAGPALADLIIGTTSPSGKLPVSFPRTVGQIPLYYNKKNTGRPNDTHAYEPFTSCYIDIDPQPLFPFGFGLSYTTFTYSNLKLSKTSLGFGENLLVSVTVKNDGSVKAD
jgi:beta-glucosidase